MPKIIVPLETDDEIYKKIEYLYEHKKMFIIHILRSNFPQKTKRVISFINENLINRRCCLSDLALTDLSNISKNMARRDNMSYDIIIHSLSDIRTPINVINEEAGEKTLALIGERTDKMLSLAGYNQLMKFIAQKFNDDDYLIRKVLYQEFASTMRMDALKRFDFSIPFHKLPPLIKNNFDIYVRERFIPHALNINIKWIWNMIANRKQSNPTH